MAEVVRYINDGSTAGGDGTTNLTTGSTRAYATSSAWEAAEGTDLVTDTDTHLVYVTGDIDFTYAHLDINGFTCNSTYYVTVRAHADDEFDATARTGATLTDSGGTQTYGIVGRSGTYMFVERLGVYQTYPTNSWLFNQHDQFIFDRCYFEVDYFRTVHTVSKQIIRNSLIYSNKAHSADDGGSPRKATLENVTVILPSGNGNYSGDIAAHECVCTNVLVYNANTSTTYDSYYFSTSDNYNASNDNSGPGTYPPPGANSIETIVSTDFEDYAGRDFHPSGASVDQVGAGADMSGTYTLDLDGVAYDTSFPIGCFEYVSAGGSIVPQIMHHRRSLTG